MKWIGQNVYDFISRFRNDVYLESISSGTIASGGNLGLDSNNKIVKATAADGDITGVTAGTGLSGGGTSGAVTLNVDASQTQITAVGTIGTGVWQGTAINQTYLAGQSGTNTGDETLASINALDITEVGTIDSGRWQGTAVASAYLDSDTAHLSETQTFTGAKTFSESIKISNTTTSSSTSGGKLLLVCDDGAAMGDDHRIGAIHFNGAEDSSNTLRTGAKIQAMADAAWSGTENGTRLEFYTKDGDNDQELSLTLDSDLLATFAGAVTVTGALTGTLATASQPNITTVGTIGTGVWQGTAVASAYLDADTMHYSAQRQITHHSFADDIDTTKHYIGFTGGDQEAEATTGTMVPLLAPVGGKLLKIFLRSNKNLQSLTFTWRLETQAGVNFGTGPSVVGTQSGAGCQNSTMTTYDFTTGLDSGDNLIDAGDMVYISIQCSGSTASTKFYVTCLWEWDLS